MSTKDLANKIWGLWADYYKDKGPNSDGVLERVISELEDWRRQPSGKLQPLGDKVVIEPIEGDTTLSSGLTLPENAREKPMKGIIIATNNNDVAKPRVGDIVLYGKHAGVEIEHEGKELLLMKETEIFAII